MRHLVSANDTISVVYMNAYEIENIIVGNQKEFRKTFERSSMLNKIANKVTYINTHNRFFHDFENIYKVTTGHCLGQNSHV